MVYATANEDLQGSTDEKAAAVHFMRFELSANDIAGARAGTAIRMGIDHDALPYAVEVPASLAASLAQDLTV